MKEAMRAAIKEGTTAIEAEPVSIVGLGDGADTSAAAVTAPAPTIVITTANRTADA